MNLFDILLLFLIVVLCGVMIVYFLHFFGIWYPKDNGKRTKK